MTDRFTGAEISEYMSDLARESGQSKVAERPTEAFGQMIKLARKEVGLSREELAEIVGVTVNSIAKYERAGLSSGQYPPIPKLAKIIAATKLDARSLMASATEDWNEQKVILGSSLEPIGEAMGHMNELFEQITPFLAGEFFKVLASAAAEDGPAKEFLSQKAEAVAEELQQRKESPEDDLPSPPSSKNDET